MPWHSKFKEAMAASLVTQTVKNSTAMGRLRFDSWFGKIPLKKGMAIHPSILAWEIPRTKEPGELQVMGLKS